MPYNLMGGEREIFEKSSHFRGHQTGHIDGPKLWTLSICFMQQTIKNSIQIQGYTFQNFHVFPQKSPASPNVRPFFQHFSASI